MNKKLNTVLFMVGATVFNLLVIAILVLIPSVTVLLILRALEVTISGQTVSILGLVFFLAALGGSFFVYGFAMRKLSERVDMDKYFEPLFRKKNQ